MPSSDRKIEDSPLVPKPFWRPKRLLFIMVTLLVIPVTGIYLAKPLMQQWRRSEGNKLVQQAEKSVSMEKYEEALNLLSKAFVKDNQNPEILRALASLLSKHANSDSQALHFWRKLIGTGAATLEDRMKMGISLVKTDQLEAAKKLLDDVPGSAKDGKAVLDLKAAILRREGNVAEADHVQREACLKEPDNAESMLTLALQELRSPFAEVQKRALDVLWKLARGKGNVALTASDTIASHPSLTVNEVDELMALVEAQKGAAERHRLAVLTAYIRLHPVEKRRVITAETTRHEKQTLDEASDFLRWLDGLNEHSLIISLVPKDKATKSTELFIAYTNALVGEQRWSEVRELIGNGKGVPLSAIDLAVLNARCSRGLGESSASVHGRLQEAMHQALAARDTNGAQKVALAAGSMGYDDLAAESYEKLAQFPQYRLQMLQRLLSLQIKQQDSKGMLDTVGQILKERPNLEQMMQSEIYLKLLLGVEMEVATLRIEDLPADKPEAKAMRAFLRAFAAMRRLDVDKAVEYSADLNPSELMPGQRAVLSGILRIGGDKHKAFEVAEKVPQQLLLLEEKQIMEHSL